MNKNLIDYDEFQELVEKTRNGEMGFSELLEYLEDNRFHLTKTEFDSVAEQLIERINHYNNAEIKNVLGNEDLRLYTYDIDDEENDDDYEVITIQVSTDFKIEQYIHIDALIKSDNNSDTYDFLLKHGELSIGRIDLKEFLQYVSDKEYKLSETFQEKFMKDIDSIINKYNKDNTTFAYKATLDFKIKHITFYELQGNKMIRSYNFKWTI